jgi:hypothetical protein
VIALAALGLAMLAAMACATLHFEAIRRLEDYAGRRRPYPTLLVVVVALIVLHMAEIGIFAGLIAIAHALHLGGFAGGVPHGTVDHIYLAAEAYASLGYGAVHPTGALRLVGAVSSLTGLLLLAWSGAFLFSLDWRAAEED